jgi:hypothetical protein
MGSFTRDLGYTPPDSFSGEDRAVSVNVVNLDAHLPRADFEVDPDFGTG